MTTDRRTRVSCSESLIIAAAAISASFVLGCVVTVGPPVLATGVAVEGPVVEGPVVDGAVAIDVEPPPDERVYVYDAGFPPGVYLDGGFYWYGGYRYPQDVFVNGYVATNLRGGLYTNVAENRRAGAVIEQQHRAEFAKTGGKRPAQVQAHAQVHAQPQAQVRAQPQAARPVAVRPAAPRPQPAAPRKK